LVTRRRRDGKPDRAASRLSARGRAAVPTWAAGHPGGGLQRFDHPRRGRRRRAQPLDVAGLDADGCEVRDLPGLGSGDRHQWLRGQPRRQLAAGLALGEPVDVARRQGRRRAVGGPAGAQRRVHRRCRLQRGVGLEPGRQIRRGRVGARQRVARGLGPGQLDPGQLDAPHDLACGAGAFVVLGHDGLPHQT